jgi:hypothetical protein
LIIRYRLVFLPDVSLKSVCILAGIVGKCSSQLLLYLPLEVEGITRQLSEHGAVGLVDHIPADVKWKILPSREFGFRRSLFLCAGKTKAEQKNYAGLSHFFKDTKKVEQLRRSEAVVLVVAGEFSILEGRIHLQEMVIVFFE